MKIFFLIICMSLFVASALYAEDRVSRYSIANTTVSPDLQNPLTVVVDVTYPPNVLTVGDAVRYLLRDSGYSLAKGVNAPNEQRILLSLPLPAAQRKTGRVELLTALMFLADPAYRLVIDKLHRQIAFTAMAEYQGYTDE